MNLLDHESQLPEKLRETILSSYRKVLPYLGYNSCLNIREFEEVIEAIAIDIPQVTKKEIVDVIIAYKEEYYEYNEGDKERIANEAKGQYRYEIDSTVFEGIDFVMSAYIEDSNLIYIGIKQTADANGKEVFTIAYKQEANDKRLSQTMQRIARKTYASFEEAFVRISTIENWVYNIGLCFVERCYIPCVCREIVEALNSGQVLPKYFLKNRKNLEDLLGIKFLYTYLPLEDVEEIQITALVDTTVYEYGDYYDREGFYQYNDFHKKPYQEHIVQTRARKVWPKEIETNLSIKGKLEVSGNTVIIRNIYDDIVRVFPMDKFYIKAEPIFDAKMNWSIYNWQQEAAIIKEVDTDEIEEKYREYEMSKRGILESYGSYLEDCNLLNKRQPREDRNNAIEDIYESLVCQGVLQWDKEKIKRIVEGDETIDDYEQDEFEDDGDSIL